MRKKIWCGLLAAVFLCGVGFVLFDFVLWRLFGFHYCRTPESLKVSTLEVEDNRCYIRVEDMVVGSFTTTKYNGMVFEFREGVLTMGFHNGMIDAKDSFSEEIVVDSPITEVRLCGNGSEQVIFTKKQE